MSNNYAKQMLESRKSKKMTLKQVALLTGVSDSAISLLERGEREPSLRIAQKISKVLEVPLSTSID